MWRCAVLYSTCAAVGQVHSTVLAVSLLYDDGQSETIDGEDLGSIRLLEVHDTQLQQAPADAGAAAWQDSRANRQAECAQSAAAAGHTSAMSPVGSSDHHHQQQPLAGEPVQMTLQPVAPEPIR